MKTKFYRDNRIIDETQDVSKYIHSLYVIGYMEWTRFILVKGSFLRSDKSEEKRNDIKPISTTSEKYAVSSTYYKNSVIING